jgi:hypothetical protein
LISVDAVLPTCFFRYCTMLSASLAPIYSCTLLPLFLRNLIVGYPTTWYFSLKSLFF